MKSPKFFYCDLFGRNIVIFHHWTEKQFADYMMKHYKLPCNLADANGWTDVVKVSKDEDHIVIWTRDGTSYPLLAHEALHATNVVLGGAGVKPSFDNDEVQCYYQMHLLKFILKDK